MHANEKSYLGLDGLLTFILSIFILLFSLGITYILTFVRVYKVALSTSDSCVSTDIIIVHGMKLTDDKINEDFTERLDKAMALHKQHKAYILLLGGIVGNNHISEAEAGKRYLIDKGIKQDSILTECQSRHTLENLSEARRLIQDLGINKSILLSNRYHLARISALANGMKMDVMLVAAEKDFKLTWTNLGRLMTEAFYLQWYYTGKYWSYATSNTHSIKRIS